MKVASFDAVLDSLSANSTRGYNLWALNQRATGGTKLFKWSRERRNSGRSSNGVVPARESITTWMVFSRPWKFTKSSRHFMARLFAGAQA